MLKIVLFSDSNKIYKITESILEGKYELVWCTYNSLEKNVYPYSDLVIMHCDKNMIKKGLYESIIKVKGNMGHNLPLLALLEGALPQDIFMALEAGAYDYLVEIENIQDYKNKIENLALWWWYLNKYGSTARKP